jgi:predicted nuclease of restriction endonuclease-like (RecB) superfamily
MGRMVAQKQSKSNWGDKVIGPLSKIPWSHNILIFTKSKTCEEALYYIRETIDNGWSRNVLALQIKSKLYTRQGKAVTDFAKTLPPS